MSKNNHLNNNLHNVSNNSSPSSQQPLSVDKSIWDMYQLLMQSTNSQSITNSNTTQLMSTTNTCCQQNESTPPTPQTLDQILLAAASTRLSPQQQSNVSPILVVINNNSHNTSLNHNSNPPMINLVNTCTIPSNSNSNTNSCGSVPNSSPLFDNQQQQFNMLPNRMLDNLQVFNFQQQQQQQSLNMNNDSTHSPPMDNLRGVKGIQKSHKMNKLTQHVSISSQNSSPNSSELNPSSPLLSFGVSVKKEHKFSRPLLKNETVLCEKNPKFKQNYFVFEKKKEKKPISFHNISVNEIISGEIQQSNGINSSNSPSTTSNGKAQQQSQPHATMATISTPSSNQKRKKQQTMNHSTGGMNLSGHVNQGNGASQFVQHPIQVFQQHATTLGIQHSIDSSSPSVSNQSSPNLMVVQHAQQQQHSNIRMTHSPNTTITNNNTPSMMDQRFNAITHQLISQPHYPSQQQSVQPQQEVLSNVMNVLLGASNPISTTIPSQSGALINNNNYTPINSFSTSGTTANVDTLLANLPPVVESLFSQQQQSQPTVIQEAATNNASINNSESVVSSSSFLDEFIMQEDLSTFVPSSSLVYSHQQQQTPPIDLTQNNQELNPEQWADLLEYVMMMNTNNNNKN